jgi:hypothetical protein
VDDLDTAQNEFQALRETMDVVTDAGADHGKNDEWRMTNDE